MYHIFRIQYRLLLFKLSTPSLQRQPQYLFTINVAALAMSAQPLNAPVVSIAPILLLTTIGLHHAIVPVLTDHILPMALVSSVIRPVKLVLDLCLQTAVAAPKILLFLMGIVARYVDLGNMSQTDYA